MYNGENMLEEPFVVIDEEKMRANLKRIHSKVSGKGTILAPHLKTHQSAELIKYYSELGIDNFTVSSIGMANYFADAGIKNITLAFPANIRQIRDINNLLNRINFSIYVDNIETARFLSHHVSTKLKVWLEIDNGYKRSGVDIDSNEELTELIELIINSNTLELVGFSVHDGTNYSAKSPTQIHKTHYNTKYNLLNLKRYFEDEYHIPLMISLGDTPAMSHIDEFSGIDVIRPGAFIFNDLQQWILGACSLDDIAAYLVAPVVSYYDTRQEILLHAGAVHLSKDYASHNNSMIYGMIALIDKNYRIEEILKYSYIRHLTQEHSIAEVGYLCNEFNIGQLVAVLPAHTCLMCASARSYYCNGKILSKM